MWLYVAVTFVGIIWESLSSATAWWTAIKPLCDEGYFVLCTYQSVDFFTVGAHLIRQVLRKSEVEKRRQIEHTLTERDIMATLRHHYILGLRISFQSADRLFMLTDYCPGGEVFFHLKKMRR